ncbi:hypothetical protein [Histophilus somni]|nr:hypothetical protein [Histophilus somni]
MLNHKHVSLRIGKKCYHQVKRQVLVFTPKVAGAHHWTQVSSTLEGS